MHKFESRGYGATAGLMIALFILHYWMPNHVASAANDPRSPVGRWHMIDDETETERGIIELTETDGQVQGRLISAVPRPGERPHPLCEKCDGARKDKPIIGMVILWGLKPDGADWAGGKILDPVKGQVYNARISLIDNGTRLNVRGYIGISLFGRSQIWLRDHGSP